MRQKFFRCKVCGNIVGVVEDHGVPLSCCGQEMVELIANTEDAAHEKHVPVFKFEDCCLDVNVGSVDHPMLEEHHISFIYVETKKGGQRKALEIGGAPNAKFCIIDDEPVAVFAYCNLHGLWKVEL